MRRAWLRGLAPGVAATLWATGAAWAQQFKSAPKAEEEGGPDTILGLIHVNTAFFIAVGVIAVVWFLVGGGRKAKVGRKGP